MSELREYREYQISDYVRVFKTKNGDVDVNFQELMVDRLVDDIPWSMSRADYTGTTVAEKRGYSNPMMTKIRKHGDWEDARLDLLEDNRVDESDAKKLVGFRSQSTTSNSKDVIKFNRTIAGNVGQVVFDGLPDDFKKYLSGYSPTNETYPFNDYIVNGVKGFVHGVIAMHERKQEDIIKKERQRLEVAAAAKRAELRSRAESILKGLGMDVTDDAIEKVIANL